MTFKPSKGLIYSLSMSFLWALAIVNSRFLLNAGEDPLNYTLWVSLLSFPLWLFLLGRRWKEYKELAKKIN